MKKATRVEEVPDALKPEPLSEDEFGFFVNTDRVRDEVLSRTEALKEELERELNPKILFAGHRGSGKSTELNRIIRDSKDRYFAVKFSVRDETDIFNINHVDLALLILEKIFEVGSAGGYIKNEQLIKDIYDWFLDITEIKEKEITGGIEAGAGVQPGILGNFLGLIAAIKSHFKISSSQKEQIRSRIEPKLSRLKDSCNVLINEVEKNLVKDGKKLLVVVEDLDKVDLPMIQEIFFKHSGILAEITTRIIFTVHIFLFNSPNKKLLSEKFREAVLPMIKVNSMDGNPYVKGREAIREILEKRMDLALLEPEGLDTAIEKTGGVLRDLFRAIEKAAVAARYNRENTIGRGLVDYGLNQVMSEYADTIIGIQNGDYSVSTESLYRKLSEIRDSSTKKFMRDSVFQVLLSCQAVIEYNGAQWFDVHPLVAQLLDQVGTGR